MFPSRQEGKTPLHCARSAETAAALLGAKAEVDAKDEVGARERERGADREKGKEGLEKGADGMALAEPAPGTRATPARGLNDDERK